MSDSHTAIRTDVPPIDLPSLISRCMGKLELVDKILEKFEGSIDQELSQLEAALSASDTEELARGAHRMRGSALTVSAQPLAKLAEQLQKLTQAADQEAIEHCFSELREECQRVCRSVESRTLEVPS